MKKIFALLGILMLGALAAPAQAQDGVGIVLNGPVGSVAAGNNFIVTVRVETPGTQQVDAVEIHLDFDPALVNVVSLTNVSPFTQLLVPAAFNNSAGTIDFGGGVFSAFPSAPFDLLVIEFAAVADGTSSLDFQSAFPRATIATFDGSNVLNAATNSSVVVGGTTGSNAPPLVSISAPTSGQTFNQNDPISFSGSALDEDGDLSAGIIWTSSIDGAFASGATYATSALELSAGTHTITASATDSGLLTGSAAIAVIVAPAPDLEAPEFDSYVAPAPVEGNTVGGATVNYPLPTATDNLDPDPIISCAPTPGSLFTVGDTPVNCTATDTSDNEATLGFTISVVDTTLPLISPTADIIAEATSPAGADVAYPTPSATDIVDGSFLPVCLPAAPVSVAVGGSEIITCNAADTAGNPAVPVTFTLSVSDQTPPLLELIGANPIGWLVDDPYTDPGATASDLVDGDLTGVIDINDSAVDITTPGSYTVAVTVTDNAGNATSATRSVEVMAQPNAGDVLFRVNTGGPQVAAADTTLPVWSADTLAIPSLYVNSADTNVVYSTAIGSSTPGPINITDASIPGSAPLDIFQTERYDQLAQTPAEMQWSFPLPASGSYELRLYFAEIFGGITGAGQRVFSVSVEGSVPPVYTGIDPFALGGGVDQARMLSQTVTVEDGALDLEFIHGVENPSIKAIEIIYLAANGGGTPPTANPDAAPAPIAIVGNTTFSVVSNDTDDLNAIDPASVFISSPAGAGNAVSNGDGTVTYTHTGLVGITDTFEYTVADTDGNVSAPALVTIEVADPATTATVSGSLTLQGKVDFSSSVSVILYPEFGSTAINSYVVSTDAAGNFSLPGIAPGTYQLAAKTSNTLQRVVTATLAIGTNPVDFGELLAGDANDDNASAAADFSVLVTTFNLTSSAGEYDARADFNGDDAVTAPDFSLLATNFNQAGEEPSAGP